MKSFQNILVIITCILFAFSVSAKKTNILVITGGHEFNRAAFFEMFDSFPDINYTEIQHPGAISQIGKLDPKIIDVVVFYDMPKNISDQEKVIFNTLTKAGTGLLFLHHSLCSYQNWDDYKTIVGGKYHEEQNSSSTSTYQHDVNFSIEIADTTHPVTKGILNFDLPDEIYGNTEVLPDVQALLTTNHPKSSKIIGWAQQTGNSKVVYIQPGHDEKAFKNVAYRKLIEQAIWFVMKT